MTVCEKCWRDAQLAVQFRGGSVTERYHELLKEREDSPCTPAQQRGDGERET